MCVISFLLPLSVFSISCFYLLSCRNGSWRQNQHILWDSRISCSWGSNRHILHQSCWLVGSWCAHLRDVGWRGVCVCAIFYYIVFKSFFFFFWLKHKSNKIYWSSPQSVIFFSVFLFVFQYKHLNILKSTYICRYSVKILSLIFWGIIFWCIICVCPVTVPRWWWGGGDRQHCKWWSTLPKIPLHRGHWYHETGKTLIFSQSCSLIGCVC